MNRRDFLRASAAVITGLDGARSASAAPTKPKVVEVTNAAWRDDRYHPNEAQVERMVNEAVRLLTGRPTAREAWQTLARPTERIGIKLNIVGRDYNKGDMPIARAVTRGLTGAGLDPANIYVVDALPQYEANRWTDFSPATDESYDVGDGQRTGLTRFLLELDAIINCPVMKDHDRAAITGALKNISHSPTIITRRPHTMHANCVTPYIAVINTYKEIRQKVRLNLLNGLLGLYEGGPSPSPHVFERASVLASFDPVALDAVHLNITEGVRAEKGLPSYWDTHRRPYFLEESAQAGIGVDDLTRIDHTVVTL